MVNDGLTMVFMVNDNSNSARQCRRLRKAECQELNNGRLAMLGITGLIAQDVLFGDFGEAAVLPCFGAAACKELFSPVGPEASTEPFLPNAAFIYPPLSL